MKRIALINRGVPGSGKSTFIKTLRQVVEAQGLSMAVHSTDDKHMVDGEYKWSMKMQGQYHRENYEEFVESMSSGINVVVCDNTNIRQRDFNKYLDSARELGYHTVAITFAPDEIEKHLVRNTHDVPEETITLMRSRLNKNLVTDLFDREVIIYPDKYSEQKLLNVADSVVSRGS